MGNTVGRPSKVVQSRLDRNQIDLAYIAGFLDGDGSVMLQMHRRKSGSDVFRVKAVICFYQDNRHLNKIEWFKQVLGCGYVYTRNDKICELRIEGFQRVFEVLTKLKPFIKFKIKQVDLMLELIPKLQQKLVLKSGVVTWIKKMQEYNYFSSQRATL